MAFKLSAKISEIIEVDLSGGHREYRVLTSLYAPDGSHLADGTGMCSSLESKYRYRGGVRISTGQPVPKEYWNLKNEGKIDEAQEILGGRGFGTMKDGGAWVICELGEKAENPDPADQFNTILKMAKKRSLIDAVLTGTGASDIFTQDIEDMAQFQKPETSGKPVVEQPKEKPAPVKTDDEAFADIVAEEIAENAEAPKTMSATDRKRYGYISEAQEKRLYAIAKQHGLSASEVKSEVWAKFDIEHCYQIPWKKYEEIIKHIEGFGNA